MRLLLAAMAGAMTILASSLASAEEASVSPAPTAPVNRASVELGYGSTASSGSPPNEFFFERVSVSRQLVPAVQLSLSARMTEDLAASRPLDAGSTYRTGADFVTLLTGLVDVDLDRHVSLTFGGLFSPPSSRDVATTLSTDQGAADALVRARSTSAGAIAEVAYDTFDEDQPHAVDAEIVLGFSGTRFASDQTILSPNPNGAPAGSAALEQGRVSLSGTVTVHDDTDVAVEASYYVYDTSNPGAAGSFDVTSRGASTSFGTGLPMLPARFSMQPEVAQRFGRFSVRVGYQLSSLAIDGAGLSHGATARMQLALGPVKVFVSGAARRDSLADSAVTDSWVASLGGNVRF